MKAPMVCKKEIWIYIILLLKIGWRGMKQLKIMVGINISVRNSQKVE